MKHTQVKIIEIATYDRKERHILTVEELKEILGEEMANDWLIGQCRTKAEANRLPFDELRKSIRLHMQVENILREKLNYKNEQMLVGFGK